MKYLSKGFLKFSVFLGFLASLSYGGTFPQVASVSDKDDMLDSYQVYLQFVAEIGREVDAGNTQKLLKVFHSLKKRSPEGAALFLKGLRFEMIQKADLMVLSPAAITNRTPEYRRFVAKYLRTWVREADEHLFRSYAAQLAQRE